MIVDPDFLTHWKTQALIEALEDQAAPVYVLALWAHCQARRTDRFPGIPHATFAKICRYPFKGDAVKFFEAMRECGFVDIEGDTVVAHGFSDTNSKLLTSWENGRLGGRPTNPKETQREPKSEKAELGTLEKRRVEKSREEKNTSTNVDVGFPSNLDSDEFNAEWKNFRAHRIKVRSAMTKRAEELILATLATRPDQALAGVRMAIEFGWKGFKWEWFDNKQNNATHQRNNTASSNRNAGTSNEGRSSQYAGVGRA